MRIFYIGIPFTLIFMFAIYHLTVPRRRYESAQSEKEEWENEIERRENIHQNDVSFVVSFIRSIPVFTIKQSHSPCPSELCRHAAKTTSTPHRANYSLTSERRAAAVRTERASWMANIERIRFSVHLFFYLSFLSFFLYERKMKRRSLVLARLNETFLQTRYFHRPRFTPFDVLHSSVHLFLSTVCSFAHVAQKNLFSFISWFFRLSLNQVPRINVKICKYINLNAKKLILIRLSVRPNVFITHEPLNRSQWIYHMYQDSSRSATGFNLPRSCKTKPEMIQESNNEDKSINANQMDQNFIMNEFSKPSETQRCAKKSFALLKCKSSR